MKSRLFCAFILALSAAAVTGCGGGSSGGSGLSGLVQHSGCPVDGLSQTQLQQLVSDTSQISSSLDPADQAIVQAGKLAFDLSQMGISESTIRTSIQNGKFAALVSWLAPSTKIDFNAFSQCEENPNAN